MYKDKSRRYQMMSQLYDTLKKKVQDEQTRGAAAANAEHTLQKMGAIPGPEPLGYLPARVSDFPEMSAVKKTSYPIKFARNQQGVEQLHPHQCSGSAPRAQTSSEIAAFANVNTVMGPPIHPTGREMLGQLSATSTPARRVSLNQTRAMTNHSFGQLPVNRTSQHFATHSVDRHVQGQGRSKHQHVGYAGPALSPNIHTRMSANRGLY